MTEGSIHQDTSLGGGLRGRVALVSGAASGVGAATVSLLAGLGVRVHGIDINADGLAAHQQALADAGLTTTWSAVDMADESAVGGAVSMVTQQHGGLDIIIASHGLNSVDDDRISELDSGLFHRIIDVNLGGVVYLAKHGTEALKASEAGVFLAVSSVAAHLPPSGPAYAAAKGGISALIRILAYELAEDGVRCVTVTPGAINTQMMRRALEKRGLTSMTMPHGSLDRPGEPIEVARLIQFLVSDSASYITGSNVTIDGGVTPF
jgi:NAD(P)-dependent dehydrogenase (short-subunit alcohol dehydrogenase family)